MTARKGGAVPRKRTALPDLVYPFKDFADGLIGGHIRALFPDPSRFEKG